MSSKQFSKLVTNSPRSEAPHVFYKVNCRQALFSVCQLRLRFHSIFYCFIFFGDVLAESNLQWSDVKLLTSINFVNKYKFYGCLWSFWMKLVISCRACKSTIGRPILSNLWINTRPTNLVNLANQQFANESCWACKLTTGQWILSTLSVHKSANKSDKESCKSTY